MQQLAQKTIDLQAENESINAKYDSIKLEQAYENRQKNILKEQMAKIQLQHDELMKKNKWIRRQNKQQLRQKRQRRTIKTTMFTMACLATSADVEDVPD